MDYPNRSGQVDLVWEWSGDSRVVSPQLAIVIDGKHCKYVDRQLACKLTPKNILGTLNKYTARSFCDEWRVPASQVAKVVRSKAYEMINAPLKKWYSTHKGKDALMVRTASMIDELEQAEKDGLHHITPFIIIHKESPSELKKRYKGVWKKLCKNTVTKNVQIATRLHDQFYMADYANGASVAESMSDAPHTVLKEMKNAGVFNSIEAFGWYSKWMKDGKAKGRTYRDSLVELRKERNIVWDTFRYYGSAANPNWSLRRVREEHENMIRQLNTEREQQRLIWDRSYSERVEKARNNPVTDKYAKWMDTSFVSDGVNCKILTTYDEVREEGVAMGHCVGSYAFDVVEQKYCVVHMEENGVPSTLGLRIIADSVGNQKFVVEQHYGKHNTPVESKNMYNLAHKVEKMLNDKIGKVKEWKSQ